MDCRCVAAITQASVSGLFSITESAWPGLKSLPARSVRTARRRHEGYLLSADDHTECRCVAVLTQLSVSGPLWITVGAFPPPPVCSASAHTIRSCRFVPRPGRYRTGPAAARRRSRLLRPATGSDDPVRPGGLGAFLVPRDAGDPGPLLRRQGLERRPGHGPGHGRVGLRRLRHARLSGVRRGRLAGRPDPRLVPRRPVRRHPHRLRPLRHGRADRHHDLGGPRPDQRGNGAAQAQCRLDGRQALPHRRRAPRRRLRALLHGHQHRRLRRPAGHRLARRARGLALGLLGRRGRYDARPGPVRRGPAPPGRAKAHGGVRARARRRCAAPSW